MHAFLIAGRDQELVQTEVQKLIKKLGAKEFNFAVQKIADIRALEKFTRLKMLEKTAVVIESFENVTEEAQNAFLKALEEPQENLFYILTAVNSDLLLPTIISRCQTLEIPNSQAQIPKEEEEKIKEFLEIPVGEKLKTTANIKSREEAVALMNGVMLIARRKLLAGESVVQLIEAAKQTLRSLKANGNVQLQLTNFVVNSDKSHLAPQG
jgi:DNA polymerase III delta prime subunit